MNLLTLYRSHLSVFIKDLSEISMPVTMNEPLDSLQVSLVCFYQRSLQDINAGHNVMQTLNSLQVSVFISLTLNFYSDLKSLTFP